MWHKKTLLRVIFLISRASKGWCCVGMLPSYCFETDFWRGFFSGKGLRKVFDLGKYAPVKTSKTQSNIVGIRQRSLGERHHQKTPYEATH